MHLIIMQHDKGFSRDVYKCYENTVLLSGVRECDPEQVLFELDFEGKTFLGRRVKKGL